MSRKFVLATFFIIVLIGTLGLSFEVQRVEASGTVYIRADGSIDPSTAPISTIDDVTYILTGDITSDTDGIVVEKDNIVIDGAGNVVKGPGWSTFSSGVTLTERSNVTIKNVNIKEFGGCGIYLNSSSNNIISGNKITSNDNGIYLISSSNGNSISANNVTDNSYGIYLQDTSNNNSVNGNNITANGNWGMSFSSSSNNSLSRNEITNNGFGVHLFESSNNSVSENNITNSWSGISLSYSSNNNSVIGNNIANNTCDIELYYSSGNRVSGNNITNSIYYGIRLESSQNNSVYHNNFFNNIVQVESVASANVWDDGMGKGNYWSDYSGTDANQDGVGDAPYIIDADNKDRYPLMPDWAFPVHNMNNGFRYATIQGAIDSNETSDGQTIFVGEGTYYEHVVITKSITLIGENREKTIVDGSYDGTVMNITASYVNVTGFTIQGSGSDQGSGVFAFSSFNNISYNIIKDCTRFSYQLGYAIELAASSNNIITRNIIVSNPTAAIFLYNSSSNLISENNITDNEYGVALSGTGLEFPEIPLSPSANNTIFGNNITNNKESGISLYRSPNNTIFRNNVSNNTVGISISDYISSNNTIYENNFTDNVKGISFITSGNRVYHNNFINNTQQASIATSGNVWDDDYPSGGNYWSDYAGIDANGDGIGDTPYDIYTNIIQDHYPLMNIIPEFPSFLILPLFMIATLLAMLVYRRKHSK